jgi:hypothetical protein
VALFLERGVTVIANSVATKKSRATALPLDCFASLAMTGAARPLDRLHASSPALFAMTEPAFSDFAFLLMRPCVRAALLLGALQLFGFIRIKRMLGVFGGWLYFAAFDEFALRVVILLRRGAIAFAFVTRRFCRIGHGGSPSREPCHLAPLARAEILSAAEKRRARVNRASTSLRNKQIGFAFHRVALGLWRTGTQEMAMTKVHKFVSVALASAMLMGAVSVSTPASAWGYGWGRPAWGYGGGWGRGWGGYGRWGYGGGFGGGALAAGLLGGLAVGTLAGAAAPWGGYGYYGSAYPAYGGYYGAAYPAYGYGGRCGCW